MKFPDIDIPLAVKSPVQPTIKIRISLENSITSIASIACKKCKKRLLMFPFDNEYNGSDLFISINLPS